MIERVFRERLPGSPSSARPSPRVAFYSHDTYGLGHLRRSLLLGEAIVGELSDSRALVATGSPRAHFFDRTDSIELVRLPSVTKNREGRYESRDSWLPLSTTVSRRKDVLRRSIEEFEPDVLVVDHAPAGLQGELLPLLADLRSPGHTRLVLGLRDILDDPEKVRCSWKRLGIQRVVEELYDDVVVYGCRELFDLGQLYDLSESTRGRMQYVGYLGRAPIAPPAADTGDTPPRVLCLVGGGGDGFPLARTFLEASGTSRYEATIVTGPFLPPNERRVLQEIAARSEGLHVLGFSARLDHLIASHDAVVTMGGYNSMMEAISYGRRTLVVPRVFPRREQWLRARAFADRGLVEMIDPKDLSPTVLRNTIDHLLDRPTPPKPGDLGVSFAGVQTFVSAVGRWCSSPVNPSGPLLTAEERSNDVRRAARS